MINFTIVVGEGNRISVEKACAGVLKLVRALQGSDFTVRLDEGALLRVGAERWTGLFVETNFPGFEQLFRRHFGVYNRASVSLFCNVIHAIPVGETGNVISVRILGSTDSTGAYACADIKCSEITLYPSFFRLSLVEQVLTLFHELTHIFSCTQDIYPGNSTPEPGFVHSDRALSDAYCYERFAQDCLLWLLSVDLVGQTALVGSELDRAGEDELPRKKARVDVEGASFSAPAVTAFRDSGVAVGGGVRPEAMRRGSTGFFGVFMDMVVVEGPSLRECDLPRKRGRNSMIVAGVAASGRARVVPGRRRVERRAFAPGAGL